jgi:hypothetical protein
MAIIMRIGFIDLTIIPKGMRDATISKSADISNKAKLSMFLQRKVHTTYNTAITVFILGSSL